MSPQRQGNAAAMAEQREHSVWVGSDVWTTSRRRLSHWRPPRITTRQSVVLDDHDGEPSASTTKHGCPGRLEQRQRRLLWRLWHLDEDEFERPRGEPLSSDVHQETRTFRLEQRQQRLSCWLRHLDDDGSLHNETCGSDLSETTMELLTSTTEHRCPCRSYRKKHSQTETGEHKILLSVLYWTSQHCPNDVRSIRVTSKVTWASGKRAQLASDLGLYACDRYSQSCVQGRRAVPTIRWAKKTTPNKT